MEAGVGEAVLDRVPDGGAAEGAQPHRQLVQLLAVLQLPPQYQPLFCSSLIHKTLNIYLYIMYIFPSFATSFRRLFYSKVADPGR